MVTSIILLFEQWKLHLVRSRLLQSNLFLSLIIFFLGYNVFIFNIDSIRYPYFDETNYITAGLQFLNHGINENWSHPPLGKLLIGLGIGLFGNNVIGWRIVSVVSGAVTLVAMFYLGLLLFKSKTLALIGVLLSALNQLLFVESRIALLDAPMFACVAVGIVLFLFHWLEGKSEVFLFGSFLCFGFAIAIKWFGLVPLLLCLLLIPMKSWVLERKEKGQTKAKAIKAVIVLVVSLGCYCGSFLICLNMKHPKYAAPLNHEKYGFQDILEVQSKMFQAQMNFRNNEHLFQSRWYAWPFMRKISWLVFPYTGDQKGNSKKQGIGIIGNPLIMWGGLMAMAFCFWVSFSEKSIVAFFISWLYLGMVLFWALIPNRTTFYYYYFPASMFLGMAIVFVFQYFQVRSRYQVFFVLTALSLFLYAYPLLTNEPISEIDFNTRNFVISFGNVHMENNNFF